MHVYMFNVTRVVLPSMRLGTVLIIIVSLILLRTVSIILLTLRTVSASYHG